MVSRIPGIVTMIWGIYSAFGYLDPQGSIATLGFRAGLSLLTWGSFGGGFQTPIMQEAGLEESHVKYGCWEYNSSRNQAYVYTRAYRLTEPPYGPW